MGSWFSKFLSPTTPSSLPNSTIASTGNIRTMIFHTKCRNSVYPRTQIQRFTVPDQLISWDDPYPGYDPTSHTADSVKGKPWADPESLADDKVWNSVDAASKVDRKSHAGRYEIVKGVPRNPMGRTGIQGRGCLGRWGPNHAADPIVTRWKRHADGKIVRSTDSNEKPVLQFVAIQRRDSGEWAIPGGMVDPGEVVTVTLRREFGEEALNTMEATPEEKEKMEKKVDDLFVHGVEIYRGYVDDPRNTDNAWMETVAYNFHDERGDSVGRFDLHAGDDAVGVNWMDIDRKVKLYASHADMIKTVAERHKAHW